jgi:hypothetical protein
MGRRTSLVFRVAKADIRVEAQQAEARIRSTKLAKLAQGNPAAVLVLEREIDDWTPKCPPDDGDVQRPMAAVGPPTLRPRALPRRVFAYPAIATGRRKAAS